VVCVSILKKFHLGRRESEVSFHARKEDAVEDNSSSPNNADAERIATLYHIALDVTLLLIVLCVAIYVFRLLDFSLHAQMDTYIKASQEAAKSPNHAPELVLDFTRALDSAIVKSIVVFMGFVVTLVGIMYVLRAATASFSLDVKSGTQSGTLNTSSPGLVIVILGIVAVGLALYSKTNISIQEGRGQPTESEATAPSPKIVGMVKAPNQKGFIDAAEKEERMVHGATVVVSANTGAPVVELPRFSKGSADLTSEQKSVLEATAYTVLKMKGAEVHYSDIADKEMKPDDWQQLEQKRQFAVDKYLKQLKPPRENPWEFFNSVFEGREIHYDSPNSKSGVGGAM
jgi:hypothetical protein